jgi:hypothetical protein
MLGTNATIARVEVRRRRGLDLALYPRDRRPVPAEERRPMAFTFKLETADGAPADPPSFTTAAPMWRPGDTIPLGGRALRVVGIRATAVDETPVVIVQDTSE